MFRTICTLLSAEIFLQNRLTSVIVLNKRIDLAEKSNESCVCTAGITFPRFH